MSNIILTSAFSSVAHILSNANALPKENILVAFIPTAADTYDTKPWSVADHQALVDLGYTVFDVDLKNKTKEQLLQLLSPAKIIFVAGGNTTYLCHYAHESGLDMIIRDLLQSGRIYIGSSAGSILAGPSVEPFVEEDTPDLPTNFRLANPECLHLVDYIVLPHHPKFEEYDKKAKNDFGDRFSFVTLSDSDYKLETVRIISSSV